TPRHLSPVRHVGPPHGRELTTSIDPPNLMLAEVLSEFPNPLLYLDDHYLIGQTTEVARDHERVVEGDDASHRLRDRALNLFVVRQDAIPAVRRHCARGSVPTLYCGHHHRSREAPLRRFVLQSLHDGDRVVAEVLHHHVIPPGTLEKTIGHDHADGVIP